MTVGTPQLRGIALWAGLALLAVINYLDLVGVLALNLSSGLVALVAAFWTGTILWLAGPSLEEIKGLLLVLVAPAVLWGAGAVALGAAYPDMGNHYVIHATVPGQVLYALAPVIELPLAVAFVGAFVAWVLEYRELRRTSPEERVLE